MLHVSSLFPDSSPPPVLPFSMGTLGFLMPFDINDSQQVLSSILRGNEFEVQQRSRLACTIHYTAKDRPATTLTAMNELVCQRYGMSQRMLSLELWSPSSGRQSPSEYITTAISDGIILSTPTGSTAYSLSAGGPIVHPAVPGVILTPICPMSLSFRPVILPADMRLLMRMSDTSRSSTAEVVIDGRVHGVIGSEQHDEQDVGDRVSSVTVQ
eukprot:Partr_v1_DN25340_c0_g1_i2_m22018 putative nad kinase